MLMDSLFMPTPKDKLSSAGFDPHTVLLFQSTAYVRSIRTNAEARVNALSYDVYNRPNDPPCQAGPNRATWKGNSPVIVSKHVLFVSITFNRIVLPALPNTCSFYWPPILSCNNDILFGYHCALKRVKKNDGQDQEKDPTSLRFE